MSFMLETRLTGFIKPKIATPRSVTQIYPEGADWEDYVKMTQDLNICPLVDVQVEMSQHWVVKENETIIGGMSVMMTQINNSTKCVCASFELMLSKKNGTATILLNMIKKHLKGRTGMCYMVVQCMNRRAAEAFWYKNLCRHREADALVYMMFMLDIRYKLSLGTTNLRITH